MKCADHILVLVEINTCFSADTAVNLGKQCGGNLYKINSPQIGCRRKSGQISGNTAAKGSQKIFSLKMIRNQKRIEFPHCIQMLMLFTSRNDMRQNHSACRMQGCFNLLQKQRRNIMICHNTYFSGCESCLCDARSKL